MRADDHLPDRRAARVALALVLGGLMMTVDTSVAVIATPAIIGDLGTSLSAAQGSTTGYLLGVVAVIPLAGWASARFGARRTYLAALVTFTLASVLAGCASSIELLVLTRVVQGLGGGPLNPVGQAIALGSSRPRIRGRIMSILGLPVAIGPVLGPPLAGWLVDLATWRWIFWINAPIGVIAVVLCAMVLPRDRGRRESGAPDWAGLAQFSSGAALLVLGATMLGAVSATGALP
ncbi:MFS transporter [Brachybacterium huguangmaarense]